MDLQEPNVTKFREIAFATLNRDADQAGTAALLLQDLKGVHEARRVSATLLHIRYDVTHVSLEMIETALVEVGMHLSNRLLCKVKRALWYYTEEVQRANLGCPRGDSNCTQKIFVSRYGRINHGCRDNRPEYWRKYL
jgi:hypothetical protein